MRRLLLSLFGLTAAVLYYARHIEPERVQITHHTLTLPNLPRAFNGYRIVQISDIHFDDWMTRRRLEDDIDRIHQQNPDLVVITGDFVTYNARHSAQELVAAFRHLHAPDGVLAIPGNHDYWQPGGIQEIRQMMQTCNMIDLSNRCHTIRRGDDALYIAGVDDVIAQKSRLDQVLALLPDEGCTILLAHEPDFADISAPTGRFDLQLSGHTHGGQVRMPLHGPLTGPTYGKRYREGLWLFDGGMQLYVNRGLGMTMLPIRLNCPPEIAVLTLVH